MADAIASLGYFSGINNVDDHIRLAPLPVKVGAGGYKAAYPLTRARNVDIDNTYAISSRDGSELLIPGKDVHSAWNDGTFTDGICLFVDGTSLFLWNFDFTVTELLSGLTNTARMSYASVNDRVYMTNGTYIGYYSKLEMHSLRNPNMKFKVPLPSGQLIAYFKGHFLVAQGPVVYIADALCDHYDMRTGFVVFEKDVTMLRPVENGIYATAGNTYYLYVKKDFADDPDDFKKEFVLSSEVVPGSDVLIDGKYVGDGIEGFVAIWTTFEGVCVGDNKGVASMVTVGRYRLRHKKAIAAATIRNQNGQVHYLATLE
ncbi:MAG: hypothetical protein LLG40_13335 [Deltaproteobacteria bacterium]|nr:hypothetical protein [Deltaproteobacteria bacterium]